MKKIFIRMIWTAVFAFVFAASAVFAADTMKITAENVTVTQGTKTVSVKISISDNPGIATVGFDVGYDASVLSFHEWTTGGEVFAEAEIDSNTAKNPFLVSAYTGKADKTGNGELITVVFDIKENAPCGVYPITLSENVLGGAMNFDEEDVPYELISGSITVVENLAPINYPDREIRQNGKPGMRFSSFVNVMQRAAADEYGFMVASAEGFGGDYSAFVFPEEIKGNTALAENETASAVLDVDGKPVKFVYATAYTKDGEVDIHKAAAMDGQEGFRFNAVMINIPESAYHSDFAVRPYLRVGNVYYYGETMVGNLFETAERYDGPQNDVIDGILAAGGNK